MQPPIALLTDFGLQDPYVGQMKGVIWTCLPGAPILDLSHGVRPQAVLQAGFFMAASWPYLPPRTISLAVVDPGVGTGRKILCCRREGKYVLAPDNGLLSQLVSRMEGCELWHLAVPDPEGISATFHGRDVFVPLACRLAQGVDPDHLGTRTIWSECEQLPQATATREGNLVQAFVLHVDHFGNCVLNLDAREWVDLMHRQQPLHLRVPKPQAVFPVTTYAHIPKREVGLIPGSQGHLELACNQRSCSLELGLDIGDRCLLALD